MSASLVTTSPETTEPTTQSPAATGPAASDTVTSEKGTFERGTSERGRLARPYRDVDIAPAAALMADPARAAMLFALLEDRPLAAGELARVAGVSAATASAHLARLLNGGFVVVQRQGRHRY